jgi:hypothetical protein
MWLHGKAFVRSAPLIVIAMSAAMLPAPGSTASAQSGDPDVRAFPGHYFGFGIAQESLPNAVDPICGRPTGRRGGSVLGAFLIMPMSNTVGIEGRVNYHARPELGCSGIEPYRDGTLTLRSTDVEAGDFPTMDLRLRVAGGRRSWWAAGVGAGWAASAKDVPYVVGNVGVRGGSRVRWGLDLELASYRVPWMAQTVKYQAGQLISVTSTELYKGWETSFGGRFMLAIPVTRR